MASKKSKLKKESLSQLPPPGPMANRISSSTSSLQNSSSVLVRTYVDEKMSLEQLMEMGSRSGQSRYEKAPRPTQKLNQLPLSFNQPQVLNRQRGSSAGHSPQGSSDDNFSHSRNTLSPGGIEGLVYGTAPAMIPRHQKQASAPELNHHQYDVNAFSPAHNTAVHQHTASLHAPSSRPVQIPQHPQQMAFGSKSVSAIDQQFAFDGSVAPPIQSHHNRSTSYDVTHAAHFNAQSFGGYQSQQAHSHQELYGLGMHQQQPHQQQQQPMQQPKEKSQSMDPIIINSVQQQQQQPQPMQQPQFETPSEIGLSLPPNWSIGHTEQGEIFFIDHSNQTTTWYDPRIPQHLQEDRIRVQHGMAAAADPNAAAAHQQAQQQAQQQAAAQQHAAQQQQQQQHHFAMGQVPQQQPQPHQMLEQSNARIQSLDSEVNAMHERQRELMQQGLYGSPQPMQYDHNVNNNLSSMDQQQYFQQQQQQQQRPPSMPTYQPQDEPMEYAPSYVAPAHMMNRYGVDNFNSDELNQYLGEMQM